MRTESALELAETGRRASDPPAAAHPVVVPARDQRVRVAGKFFRLGEAKWYLKGVTYGPFAPNSNGEFLPENVRLRADFAHIRALGANAIRVYWAPSRGVLDEALDQGLRVLIDVPWQKHRCVFEDWPAWEESYSRVRRAAKELGDHPAALGISVVNEIPGDIVRFYGARRVERFIDELVDAAKQEAPDCPVSFANYPPTEFLRPAGPDFCCFNLYLNDTRAFGEYLDRLQHAAGSRPLILGECGVDARREGPLRQAALLARQTSEVFRRGLAGSFVFSYTDDWFTGGRAVDEWDFGITDRVRRAKPSAAALRRVWLRVPRIGARGAPRVSVVVCSFDGASTLDECLASLVRLDYPDYEVILVDDGSTDSTPQIAERYPDVRYIRQANHGLSAARNVGAAAATGEVIAYTDSDCVADEHWLLYLVRAMREQKVQAVGGPNLPPPSDSWTAKCVAASPGGPSHVMLDDRRAEHVPGCNMAFGRAALMAVGGFDPQFRQAGDDVDICWRLLDAGLTIGYAPAAMVWHHRRHTVRAYLKQQKGYGRAEAMLHFKHPHRFTALGCPRWHGVIYGEAGVRPDGRRSPVYHGRFGSALFQVVYPGPQFGRGGYCLLLEWHAIAALLLVLAVLLPPLAVVGLLMEILSLIAAARSAGRTSLAPAGPWWCRPLVFCLHLAQPVARACHRNWYRFRHKRLPAPAVEGRAAPGHLKAISVRDHDLYWTSADGRGRLELLEVLVARAGQEGWSGDYHAEWKTWDLELAGDPWHDLEIRTATEELGGLSRYTRARCRLRLTAGAVACTLAALAWTAAAIATREKWAMATGLVASVTLTVCLLRSRRRCLRAAGDLIRRAARQAGLHPASQGAASPSPAISEEATVAEVST